MNKLSACLVVVASIVVVGVSGQLPFLGGSTCPTPAAPSADPIPNWFYIWSVSGVMDCRLTNVTCPPNQCAADASLPFVKAVVQVICVAGESNVDWQLCVDNRVGLTNSLNYVLLNLLGFPSPAAPSGR